MIGLYVRVYEAEVARQIREAVLPSGKKGVIATSFVLRSDRWDKLEVSEVLMAAKLKKLRAEKFRGFRGD
jgi:hypothetical protein